jgi:hypothetical protein
MGYGAANLCLAAIGSVIFILSGKKCLISDA